MPKDEKSTPVRPTNNLELHAPFHYADRVIDVNLGVYVSRMVFGMESAPGQALPNLVVGIPTIALIDFCEAFLLSTKNSHGLIAEKLDSFKLKLDKLGKTPTQPKRLKAKNK